MNLEEILDEGLITDAFGRNLILLDIDDTLLTAQNIYIHRKLPADKTVVKLTPAQYAEEKVSAENKQYYNYDEFRNPDTVARSIKTGLPIIPNLKVVDDYIKKGWKVGILTARGLEDVIFKSMKEWLQYRNKRGDLKKIGHRLIRKMVYAINDDNKKYKGSTDFERKVNVIKTLSKKYKKVIFIDDDLKNVNAVRDVKLPNVQVIQATAKAGDK